MSIFSGPKIPAPPPPPPPPPAPPTLASSGVAAAAARSQDATALAAGMGVDDTIKTSAQGAAAPTTDKKTLLGQ